MCLLRLLNSRLITAFLLPSLPVKRHHLIKGKRTEVKKALSKQEMDNLKRKSEARQGGGRGGGGHSRGSAPVWDSGPGYGGGGGGFGGGGYGGPGGAGGCKCHCVASVLIYSFLVRSQTADTVAAAMAVKVAMAAVRVVGTRVAEATVCTTGHVICWPVLTLCS